jgi:hypothetical protein
MAVVGGALRHFVWLVFALAGCYQAAPPFVPDSGQAPAGSDAGPTGTDAGQLDAGPGNPYPLALRASLGYDHGCEVPPEGSLRCWGTNGYGQRGDEGSETVSRADAVAAPTSLRFVEAVAAGHWFTCGVGLYRGAELLKCWGNLAEFGVDEQGPWNLDLRDHHVRWLGAGWSHLCVLMDDTSVWCAGSNSKGQLKQATELTSSSFLVQVHAPGAVRLLSVGSERSCAVMSDDTVHCWGALQHPVEGETDEVIVPGIDAANITAIASGYDHTCVIVSGSMVCWGSNTDYQMGDQSSPRRGASAVDFGLDPIVDLSVSRSSTCTLNDLGVLACRGGDESRLRSARDTGLRRLVHSGLWANQHCGYVGDDLRCFDLDGTFD